MEPSWRPEAVTQISIWKLSLFWVLRCSNTDYRWSCDVTHWFAGAGLFPNSIQGASATSWFSVHTNMNRSSRGSNLSLMISGQLVLPPEPHSLGQPGLNRLVEPQSWSYDLPCHTWPFKWNHSLCSSSGTLAFAVRLTGVDRETAYSSRSPSPCVQVANRPPVESIRPGWGARWRFPTVLGTGEKRDEEVHWMN